MDNLAQYIDYTILKPELPFGVYTEGYRDCLKYGFASFCVNPFFVPLINNLARNHPESHTKICTVIGFPLGLNDTTSKLVEVNRSMFEGAQELDAVINISAVKTGDWNRVTHELEALRYASANHVLKVIFEVGLLTDAEIINCCAICVDLEIDFVKTSTGFLAKLTPDETARYVKIMSDCVIGTKTQVKASGFIKTLKDCQLMLAAGATRIGTSSAVSIMQELESGR